MKLSIKKHINWIFNNIRKNRTVLCILLALAVVSFCFKTEIVSWYRSFNYNLSFISDVIALQAAIIAIAIPLSFDIISRISERYKSGVITRQFNNYWYVKFLPLLVVFNSVLAISLKFFIVKESGWWLEKLLIFVVFITFNTNLVVLVIFFNRVRKYATETRFILDILFKEGRNILYEISFIVQTTENSIKENQPRFENLVKEMQEILTFNILHMHNSKKIRYELDFSRNPILNMLFNEGQEILNKIALATQNAENNIVKCQSIFDNSIEGIGDILTFNTFNKTNNTEVRNGLNSLRELIDNFLIIKENNPEAFNILVLPPGLRSPEVQNSPYRDFYLSLPLGESSTTLHSITNQIERVFRAALESKNLSIFQEVTSEYIRIFKKVSSLSENELVVKYTIDWVESLIKNYPDSQKLSFVPAYIYIEVVFEPNFDTSYIDLFDRYLTLSMRDVITAHESQFFNVFVGKLFMSSKLREHEDLTAFEQLSRQLTYSPHYNIELNQKVQELRSIVPSILTSRELNNAISLVDSIKKSIRDLNNSSVKPITFCGKKLKGNIKSWYKFNHLMNLIFDIGAYCLFKQRYEYISYLWNYKQPPDARAIWLGPDVLPYTISEVTNFYLRHSAWERKITSTFQDRHECNPYYQKYFLLLLLREFSKDEPVQNYEFPNNLESYRLNDIKYESEELIHIARNMKNDFKNTDLFALSQDEFDNNINTVLIPFLHEWKEKIDKRLKEMYISQPIDLDLIDEYKRDFVKGFQESAQFRKIISSLELYEERSEENGDRFGQPTLGNGNFVEHKMRKEKSSFLKQWYLDTSASGETDGRILALAEDRKLLTMLIARCSTVLETDIDFVLATLSDLENWAIVGLNWKWDRIDTDKICQKPSSDNIKEAARSDRKEINSSRIYKFKDIEIPFYQIFSLESTPTASLPADVTILLNKSKLGRLTQYSSNAADDKNSFLNLEINYFTDDSASIPTWIKDKIGIYKAELPKYVWVKAYEKITFDIVPDFQGYLVTYR